MPSKAKRSVDQAVEADPLDRISRALALIAVRGLEKEDAAMRLLAVGFDSPEIGGLLSVNPNFANAVKSKMKKVKR